MTPITEGYLSNPTFRLGNDETGGPAFFWTNPWTGKSEKVASLWWPEHPEGDTKAVEELFDSLCLCRNLPGHI